MDHKLQRSKIPGVRMTHDFGGRRPSRSIRRYNRRVIAEARAAFVEQKAAAPTVVVKPPPANYPVAYEKDLARTAKNARGDCPVCGKFGENPRKKFRHYGTGNVVELRQCTACNAKFSDLPPVPEAAPPPPTRPTFERLPDSKHNVYHDCPNADCDTENVNTYVLVLDAYGLKVEACKCPNCGTLFKPATHRNSVPPSRLVT